MMTNEELCEFYEQVATRLSVLGDNGVELLPALDALLREEIFEEARELRRRRRRRLTEEHLIRAWASYRDEMRQLRDRLRRHDDLDLELLIDFVLAHLGELVQVSAVELDAFRPASANADALVRTADWHAWLIGWLRDALPPESEEPDSGSGAPPELRPIPPSSGPAPSF